MQIIGNKIIYNADDEEPLCGRCDYVCDSQSYCDTNCGSEHFWNGYERTEYLETLKGKKGT